MKIDLICSALPPALDGIGDYTAHLAVELAGTAQVRVLTGSAQPWDAIPGVPIVSAFDAKAPATMSALSARIAADPPDWVVLQYNPFSYGRRGLNLRLPQVMRAIRRGGFGTKFALMVHEPFVPVLDWKHAAMTTWQRWQLWQLGRSADVLFFSIEPWAGKFERWFPGKPVRCLPVGSNIPCIPTDRDAARAALGIAPETVVLGFFGTAHNSRLLSWVRGAAEAVAAGGRKTLTLYVGPDREVMGQVLAGLPLRAEGALPGPEVSQRFAAMDIHLSPFVDGISTRRGSFLAGLQHGLATVGTYGYNTEAALRAQNGQAFLLTDAHSPALFNAEVQKLADDSALRACLGAEAQRLFASRFAWDKITTRLMDTLQEH